MIFSIIHDLTTNPHSCPSANLNFTPKKFSRFINLIKAHKLHGFLYHFISCKKCQKQLSRKQLTQIKKIWEQKKLYSQALFQEAKNLNSIFKKNKITAIQPNNLSWLPIYQGSKIYQTAIDIDMVIKKSTLKPTIKVLQKNSYKIKKTHENYNRLTAYHWQEITLEKKSNPSITIDLQWSVGQNILTPLHLFKNASPASLIKKTLNNHKPGLTPPQKPSQFLFLSAQFLFNDAFYGMRQAQDLKEIALNISPKQWSQTIDLAKQTNLLKPFWFTLLTLENLFNKKLIPEKHQKNLPTQQIILSQLNKISIIQTTTPNQKIQEIFYTYPLKFSAFLQSKKTLA